MSRGQVEDLIAALGWGWSRALSLDLDAAVIAEEAAA